MRSITFAFVFDATLQLRRRRLREAVAGTDV
jgi:hypothetical protein